VSGKGGPGASFMPDRVGTYRLGLTVNEGARSGSDVLTITNIGTVPPIGVPVDTMAFNDVYQVPGADAGIRVGDTTYWLGNANLPSPQYLVKAVILDRTTLEPKFSASYDGNAGDAVNLLAQIKRFGNSAIVIVSATDIYGNGGVNPAFAFVVKALGGKPIPNISNLEGGWTIVGIPGAGNAAYEGAGSNNSGGGVELRGRLTGYFQQDSFDKFTFVPGTRPSFDTAAPDAPALQNTIRVGSQTYGSGGLAACGTGGFQVLVLAAETLAQVDSQTFTTNGCGATADEARQASLASYLSSGISVLDSRGNKLVAVQSIGTPRGSDDSNWAQIAQAISTVGGTPATFAAATGRYALVGGIGIGDFPLTEQSASLTGASGRISGVLKQNREGSFRPEASVPGPISTYGLSAIAYQPPQAWPYSQTPGEQAALAYIAGKLPAFPKPTADNSCYVPARPDVRSEYCNLSLVGDWATYSGQVTAIPYAAGRGFTPGDLTNVAGELSKEFLIVSQLWPTIAALQQPFGTASQKAEVDLNSIATHIQQGLKAPARKGVAADLSNLVGDLLTVASYFAPEAAAGLISTEGASFNVAADVTSLASGAPAIGNFNIKVQDLAVDLASSFLADSTAIEQVGSLLVTDYGKLTAFAANPNYEVSSTTVTNTAPTISANSRGWINQVLVGATYEAFQLQPTGSLNYPLPTNANSYRCDLPLNEGGNPYNPFKASTGAQYYLTDLGAPTLLVMVVQGSNPPDITPSNSGDPLRSPPGPVIDAVFDQPGQGQGGAGQFRPWFWRQALGFGAASGSITTVTCRDG
jgi:hypothetical protein